MKKALLGAAVLLGLSIATAHANCTYSSALSDIAVEDIQDVEKANCPKGSAVFAFGQEQVCLKAETGKANVPVYTYQGKTYTIVKKGTPKYPYTLKIQSKGKVQNIGMQQHCNE